MECVQQKKRKIQISIVNNIIHNLSLGPLLIMTSFLNHKDLVSLSEVDKEMRSNLEELRLPKYSLNRLNSLKYYFNVENIRNRLGKKKVDLFPKFLKPFQWYRDDSYLYPKAEIIFQESREKAFLKKHEGKEQLSQDEEEILNLPKTSIDSVHYDRIFRLPHALE